MASAWDEYQQSWDWGQEPPARDVFAAGVIAGAKLAAQREDQATLSSN